MIMMMMIVMIIKKATTTLVVLLEPFSTLHFSVESLYSGVSNTS